MHATSRMRLAALRSIAVSLTSQQDDLHVIATYDPAQLHPPGDSDDDFAMLIPLPSTGGSNSRQIIANWRPDVGIWTGGHLNGPAIRVAAEAGTKLILMDADTDGFRGRRRRWFGDPVQDTLNRFQHALAGSPEAADLLRRAGFPPERIEVTSRLQSVPVPPDCPDEEVTSVSQELRGRPVWLAAFAHPDEFGFIVTAQRNAVRLSHRLLLVILLEDRAYLSDLLSLLEGMTLRHAVWHLGDPIDDQLQVLVADDPEDLGLWYRVAPQTFLGHSLVSEEGGRCPLDAAALGSAVLHGPHVGAYSDSYIRLTGAGAAQLVPDGNALGVQVSRLIAPDLAARMALAGWDVATEGAELTGRVAALVRTLLEADRAPHARA